MELQTANSFSKVFKTQSKRAINLEEKVKNGDLKNWQIQREATSISNGILRDDITYQLQNGKTIKFTARVKKLIKAQQQLLRRASAITSTDAVGKCIVCGKPFSKGDIILQEKYDNSNKLCLSCCSGNNSLSLSKECKVQLVECK